MKKYSVLLALALMGATFMNSINNVSAATYQTSITTSGDIKLIVSTAGNGANTATDNVDVISTCPYGYTVSVAATSSANPNFASSNDTSLYKSGDKASTSKIAPTTGTRDNPTSIIDDNRGTWGYNITSPDATGTFIGLTTTPTLLTSKSSGTGETGETIPVYYGASASFDTESGKYIMSDDAAITYYLTTSPECTSTDALLDTGPTVNEKLKAINSDAEKFVRADNLPSGFTPSTENTISHSSSASPIYV